MRATNFVVRGRSQQIHFECTAGIIPKTRTRGFMEIYQKYCKSMVSDVNVIMIYHRVCGPMVPL